VTLGKKLTTIADGAVIVGVPDFSAGVARIGGVFPHSEACRLACTAPVNVANACCAVWYCGATEKTNLFADSFLT
jgi:hypothetical protein